MLHHTVDFAERYRFLGRASEAQIESYHAQFNRLFHHHHLNQGGNTPERLRRSLVDATLRTLRAKAVQKKSKMGAALMPSDAGVTRTHNAPEGQKNHP
jgi:uncharacterized protein YdcH (DUF465 family)